MARTIGVAKVMDPFDSVPIQFESSNLGGQRDQHRQPTVTEQIHRELSQDIMTSAWLWVGIDGRRPPPTGQRPNRRENRLFRWAPAAPVWPGHHCPWGTERLI